MNDFVYRDCRVDISFRLAKPKGYVGIATITRDDYGDESTRDVEAPGVHDSPSAASLAAEAAARKAIDELRETPGERDLDDRIKRWADGGERGA